MANVVKDILMKEDIELDNSHDHYRPCISICTYGADEGQIRGAVKS